MPKLRFEKAFYISFHAHSVREKAINFAGSYYKEENGHHIAFENHTIDFARSYRRKLIPSPESVPMCRINFAFDGSQARFDKEELNIDPNKTNTEIAERILSEFLKNVTSYSVVYIAAHGDDKSPHRISQQILMPDGSTEICHLQVDYLAKLMYKYIPLHSQNNLKVHLFVCHGGDICTNFMKVLNDRRFKKTVVVGYTSAFMRYPDNYTIEDFSTTDRRIYAGKYKHGKNFPKIKE